MKKLTEGKLLTLNYTRVNNFQYLDQPRVYPLMYIHPLRWLFIRPIADGYIVYGSTFNMMNLVETEEQYFDVLRLLTGETKATIP